MVGLEIRYLQPHFTFVNITDPDQNKNPKFRSFRGSKCSCEVPWRLKIQSSRVAGPAVADSLHYGEDPDPHLKEY